MRRKQCAESNNFRELFCCFFFFPGKWPSKSWSHSSGQPQVFREHGLWQDGQTGRVWAAAVRSPHRAHLCGHGKVRQTYPWGERRGSHSLLAGGGCLHRLCDLCDSAGVGSCQIPDLEEEEVYLGDHTVVSTTLKRDSDGGKKVMRNTRCMKKRISNLHLLMVWS